MKDKVWALKFKSWQESVVKILELAELAGLVKDQKKIILKPNLTINYPPPCTTPVEMVEEVIKFIGKYSQARIIIAEGSGGCDTIKSFEDLGYEGLAKKYKVGLVDLNREKREECVDPKALAIKKVKLPTVLMDGFLINLPVLKQHDSAVMTAAAKNMFGVYLNDNIILKKLSPHWWNKSELHFRYGVAKSVWDLNLHRKTDFVLVDATVGQVGNEIEGKAKNPPIGMLVAGFDNLAVDRVCAPMIGVRVEDVPYLNFR